MSALVSIVNSADNIYMHLVAVICDEVMQIHNCEESSESSSYCLYWAV